VTRTRPTVLIVLAVIGAGAGWLLQLGLQTSGRPIVIPPVTLAIALSLIGILVLLAAIPVYRSVIRAAQRAIDPFYATRVVLLAKASSLTGALLGGALAAFLIFLLSRPVVAAVGSVSIAIFTTVGAIVLLVGGLVAEKMCTLPPEDDEKSGPSATTR